MIFEWDDAKRASNLAKHGIDFLDASRLFDGRQLVMVHSASSEELRYLSTRIIDDRFITVIWTRRNGAFRTISARRARDSEKRCFRALHGSGA